MLRMLIWHVMLCASQNSSIDVSESPMELYSQIWLPKKAVPVGPGCLKKSLCTHSVSAKG